MAFNINIAALSKLANAATSLSNLVLVTPQKTLGYQPQNPPNQDGTASTQPPPPTLLFHYEGEQTVQLKSDISDHYVEDNTAIQDQIALRPEMITVHGFIGELNDLAPPGLEKAKFWTNKLTTISSYAPKLTTTATNLFNTASRLYSNARNVRDSAVATWGTVTGTGGQSVIGSNGLKQQPNQNKQQVAFQQFYGYWRSRTLFTVQTPWAVFQNCAIDSLRAVQDAETRVISEFEITFKLLRFANTIVLGTGQFQFEGFDRANIPDKAIDFGVSPTGPSVPFRTTA